MNTQIIMKGQPRAVEQAQGWIDAIRRNDGTSIRPCMVFGPAGTGKTFLSHAIMAQLENDGWECHSFATFAEIARGQKDCASIHERMTSGRRVAVHVDEIHHLRGGEGLSMSVKAAWMSLLLSLGERMPNHSAFPLFIGKEAFVSWPDVALIISTNQPDKLEERASLKQGERPFRRRLRGIELSNYGPEIIREVIGDFLDARGLKAADCSRGMIARFHRGNLEALSDVVEEYTSKFPDHSIMSKERVIAAARLTKWFPRGLNRQEVRLLSALLKAGGSMRKSHAAPIVGCEPSAIVGTLAHLTHQFKDDGEPCPFIDQPGAWVHLTKAGATYLTAVLREGFTI